MSDITTKEQTIGFDGEIAIYNEGGWAERPLLLNRDGDTSLPLTVNVKFSPTLNDNAPGAQYPIYTQAVEIHWKAGESGKKEVPLRIKVGSVQTKGLGLEALLEIPFGQDVQMEKGRGQIFIRIDNQHTSYYQDKSAEYVAPRSAKTFVPLLSRQAIEVSASAPTPVIAPFDPPTI